jgi:hypothetical protein
LYSRRTVTVSNFAPHDETYLRRFFEKNKGLLTPKPVQQKNNWYESLGNTLDLQILLHPIFCTEFTQRSKQMIRHDLGRQETLTCWLAVPPLL